LKPHRPLIEAIAQNLKIIFTDGKYADRVIETCLKKNVKWGARDRRFVAENTYNIVRNYRLLYESAGTKTPWMVVAANFIIHDFPLPDWKEFAGITPKLILKNYQEKQNIFAVAESIPDWLDELGRKELGEIWEREVHALNQEAKVVLRANTLKTTAKELQSKLAEQEIQVELYPKVPETLILNKRQPVFFTQEFKNGLFELQDVSSQKVAHFMQLDENMRVTDACAGAGGKSLHIAALMKNKGKIISMDVEEFKLTELKKRAARAGVHNIEVKTIDTKTIKRLESSSDRVLLDVPCSGLGVLRRNPDTKWKLTPESIESVKKVQQKILNDYSSMVKPGGKLIYVTCSILPSENSEQVKKFLEAHPEFTFEEEKTILPSEGFDGFYMCRMVRGNNQ
jgi:16S rRNA (cytosine967-C5)-methyltransferase